MLLWPCLLLPRGDPGSVLCDRAKEVNRNTSSRYCGKAMVSEAQRHLLVVENSVFRLLFKFGNKVQYDVFLCFDLLTMQLCKPYP